MGVYTFKSSIVFSALPDNEPSSHWVFPISGNLPILSLRNSNKLWFMLLRTSNNELVFMVFFKPTNITGGSTLYESSDADSSPWPQIKKTTMPGRPLEHGRTHRAGYTCPRHGTTSIFFIYSLKGVCLYVYVYTYLYIYIPINMYVCMYECMYVCTYVRTYVRMYVCM